MSILPKILPKLALRRNRNTATGQPNKSLDYNGNKRQQAHRINAVKLNWTLAFLALCSLPFVAHLPLWPIAILFGAIFWRWQIRRRKGKIPNAAIRLVLTICLAGVVYKTFGTFNGIEPGTSLLLVMAAMKLFESVTERDLLVLIFMSFFMLLAAFLFDQSIVNTVFAVAAAWIGVTALVQVNRDSEPDSMMPVFRTSGRMVLQALPLLLILFVLFPRVPGPFWALPSTDNATTGLSDSMSPGSISNLLQSGKIAFRAYFDDTQPKRKQLYWRGPVLEVIDDRTWTRRQQRTEISDVQLRGTPLNYTMVIEPHQTNWLLALDFPNPQKLPPKSYFTGSGQLLSTHVITDRKRIQLESYPEYTIAPKLDDAQRTLNLDTSKTDNPRTRVLAKEWQTELRRVHKNNELPVGTRATLIANRALAYFNQEPFVYSLTNAGVDRTNSVDSFLFDKRRGFCEHYASSFTLLMRFAGIPARVVTGYMGGEVNTLSGHTTVRHSDAHAWSEVWIENRGWVRFDPTGAVAPSRVERGISGALPDGESLPTLMMRSSSLITGLRHTMDAINANWNDWVLGYSDERQWSLLRRLGIKNRNLPTLMIILVVSIGTALFLLTLWLKRRSAYNPTDPVLRVHQAFIRLLEKHQVKTRTNEDALALAKRASKRLPTHAKLISEFCNTYQEARYGRLPPPDSVQQLRSLLRDLTRQVRRSKTT